MRNIYDDPAFFAGYRDLRTNDTGRNGALELPALPRLLPGLAGAHVPHHRTIETCAGALLDAGFALAHLGEPGPAPDALAARPAPATETRRPPFLVPMGVKPC